MFTKSFLGAAAMAMVLGLAGRASAQTCTTDKDCPQGQACHAQTVVNPSEPDCKPNTDCPPRPDGGHTTSVVMSCETKDCTADAECGDGMVCHAFTSTACSGGGSTGPACAPDMPCDAGPPVKTDEMCTTTTFHKCAFKWELPCNMDTDCGAGFTCKPITVGSCSGGGGVAVGGGTSGGSSGAAGAGGSTGTGGSSGNGDVKPPPPPPAPTDAGPAPMCMETTSYPGYCQPKVTTCTADSECPGGWKCTEIPTVVVSPPVRSGAPGAPTDTPVAAVDAGAPTPAQDAGPAVKMCTSPYGGCPTCSGGRGYDDGKGTTGPTAPGDNGNHGGTTGGAPETPPAGMGGATADGGATTTPAKTSGGGCSFGAGGGASGLGLALVAALLLRRRRK